MFSRYFHARTAHSPLVYRIISPRLLNAEVEEHTFAQCKAITRSSNQHTDHIPTNILVHMNFEQQKAAMQSETIHKQDSEVSKLVRALPPKRNTLIPREWIEHSPVNYQAHLERIGDYLLPGPGVWWQYVDSGVEFFDVDTPGNPLNPTLNHF